MLQLKESGHNDGGRHTFYRALKTFLYWWEDEVEPDNWSNPIRKAKPPKLSIEPLKPANLADIKAMITTCDKTFTGRRDKAILLALLDTVARAKELIEMKVDNFN